ncbi:MAG: Mg(2+) transporter [Peltula sp. TS41687]|nr:MAG: Mg(2+) transporter [Peltula sp. TS41687]
MNRITQFSPEMETPRYAASIGDMVIPGVSRPDPPEGSDEVQQPWWYNIADPTEEEMNTFAKALSIHPLTVEDIITKDTREKVEMFKHYYFVCFRSCIQSDGNEKKGDDVMEAVNMYLIVFREGILTFTFGDNMHVANVHKRMSKYKDYVVLSSDWICYALIDDVVDMFGRVQTEVEREIYVIEDQEDIARDDDIQALLRQIGSCRRKVMGLMRLLGGKADVIRGFEKRCNELYAVTPRGEISLYLDDVQDHLVTMTTNLAHFEKILANSRWNYMTQIHVQAITTGNQTNQLLGRITTLATIIAPLNLIAGLFGMNVPFPGKGDGHGYGLFVGIIGAMLAFGAVCAILARKYKYM